MASTGALKIEYLVLSTIVHIRAWCTPWCLHFHSIYWILRTKYCVFDYLVKRYLI